MSENSSKPGEEEAIILPKNLETRHVITARLGQSKASAVLFIPCEIRPRPKGQLKPVHLCALNPCSVYQEVLEVV